MGVLTWAAAAQRPDGASPGWQRRGRSPAACWAAASRPWSTRCTCRPRSPAMTRPSQRASRSVTPHAAERAAPVPTPPRPALQTRATASVRPRRPIRCKRAASRKRRLCGSARPLRRGSARAVAWPRSSFPSNARIRRLLSMRASRAPRACLRPQRQVPSRQRATCAARPKRRRVRNRSHWPCVRRRVRPRSD